MICFYCKYAVTLYELHYHNDSFCYVSNNSGCYCQKIVFIDIKQVKREVISKVTENTLPPVVTDFHIPLIFL